MIRAALFGALAVAGCQFQVLGLPGPDGAGLVDAPEPADLSGDMARFDPCPKGVSVPVGTLLARPGAKPTVNGALNDPVWVSINALVIERGTPGSRDQGTWSGGPGDANNLAGHVWASWDAENLYLAVKVIDNQPRSLPKNGALVQYDSVELFFDGDRGRTPTYQADDRRLVYAWDQGDRTPPPGAQLCGGDTPCATPWSGIVAATADRTDGSGWALELAVPWSAIGAVPAEGAEIGFDLLFNDNDSGGMTRERALIWYIEPETGSPPADSPAAFGRLHLCG